jgi:putative addiction module component (TIGR02574 family)
MAQPLPSPPPEFDGLSVEDKIEYVNSLWDRITSRPEDIPVPEWHLQVLRERLARDEEHSDEALPWEDVREEILKSLHDRR